MGHGRFLVTFHWMVERRFGFLQEMVWLVFRLNNFTDGGIFSFCCFLGSVILSRFSVFSFALSGSKSSVADALFPITASPLFSMFLPSIPPISLLSLASNGFL